MKTTALITARMGSSRLPGKSMMPILGKPMIERMIERVRHSQYIEQIVIATTELMEDDTIESLAARIGVGCFRGSVQDVLGRINAAAVVCDADLVVELLGDNPLVHADLIDDVVEFYKESDFDYTASVTTEYPHAGPELMQFPIGTRVEVFSQAVLDRCEELANEPYYREHSTSFIYEHPDMFRLGYFEARGKWRYFNRPELTFAVNYQENLNMVRRIFERCYPVNPNFPLSDVIRTLDSDPTLRPLMGSPSYGSAEV